MPPLLLAFAACCLGLGQPATTATADGGATIPAVYLAPSSGTVVTRGPASTPAPASTSTPAPAATPLPSPQPVAPATTSGGTSSVQPVAAAPHAQPTQGPVAPGGHALPPRKNAASHSRANTTAANDDSRDDRPITAVPPATLLAALAGVIGLLLLVAWSLRRGSAQPPLLSTEVLEVLGRAPIGSRHHLHLIRLGRKLVLVNSTPSGIEGVAEVDDPVEVDRLVGLCQASRAGSATAVFRQVLEQFAGGNQRQKSSTARAGALASGKELWHG